MEKTYFGQSMKEKLSPLQKKRKEPHHLNTETRCSNFLVYFLSKEYCLPFWSWREQFGLSLFTMVKTSQLVQYLQVIRTSSFVWRCSLLQLVSVLRSRIQYTWRADWMTMQSPEICRWVADMHLSVL